MKLAIGIGGHSRDGILDAVQLVQAADRIGVDSAWAAESWGPDAPTTLAFLAAKTERIALGSAIMQISARAPSMTAMTSLSLAELSGGRFRLGLGVSGPQVVEGLHGVSHAKPLTRLREHVEICRLAFRGEKLEYHGRAHELPLPGGEGKPIRLFAPPSNVPIYLATLGPRSLEYTGEAADGWLGTSFSPEAAGAHLDHIARGAAKAGRSLADIDINVNVEVAIGENVEELIDARRMGVAFQMGAMGSRKTNYYNEAIQRSGYADDALAIQSLWKDGRRDEAAARVPDEMIARFQAVGTPEMVRERFEKYRAAGVNTIKLRMRNDETAAERIALLEQAKDILDGMAVAA